MAAGWKRSSSGFSWGDTIQRIGKVVIVPSELSVSGQR